jgi:hypothetical protein
VCGKSVRYSSRVVVIAVAILHRKDRYGLSEIVLRGRIKGEKLTSYSLKSHRLP